MCTNAGRLAAPGAGAGLVPSVRTELGALGNTDGGWGTGSPGNLQQRFGSATHGAGVHAHASTVPDADQHGGLKPLAGQRLHRAAVVLGEVAADLSGQLYRRTAIVDGSRPLFPVPQPQSAAPGACRSKPSPSVRLADDAHREALRWRLRPKPRDLPFSARLAGSMLEIPLGCRTLEEHRRRTGRRRNATRAPRGGRTDGAAPMPPFEPAPTYSWIGQNLSAP